MYMTSYTFCFWNKLVWNTISLQRT